eukprot:8494514-Pyramimonas_sp.AAC.1
MGGHPAAEAGGSALRPIPEENGLDVASEAARAPGEEAAEVSDVSQSRQVSSGVGSTTVVSRAPVCQRA